MTPEATRIGDLRPDDEVPFAVYLQSKLDGHPSGNPSFSLKQAIIDNLSRMDIDINERRTPGQKVNFLGSACTALQYAYLKTGRDPSTKNLTEKDGCHEFISTVLDDQEMNEIFHENLWRPITTFCPARSLPLPYIINHHFNDKPIYAVDLGAGVHTALPSLNTSQHRDVVFSGKDQISQYARPVTIGLGLGVDMQERENNLLWTKAGLWPTIFQGPEFPTYEQFDDFFNQMPYDETKFPFLVLDIEQAGKNAADVILPILRRKANTVLTSFVRHQFHSHKEAQDVLRENINSLLEEGGLWIDMGGEILSEIKRIDYDVNVYEKIKGELILKGVPFIIEEAGQILKTDLDYFKAA